MSTEGRLFTGAQITSIQPVLDHAEELVGDRFAVPSFRTGRYAYDVRTLAELDPIEIPEDPALAQIVRYGREPARGRLSRFHRICLHDTRILLCLVRHQLILEALLLAVLSHELIHLVRFSIPQAGFHVPPDQRRAEESEVDELTRRLLARYPDQTVLAAVAVVTYPGPGV
jgi:hypothetical protein